MSVMFDLSGNMCDDAPVSMRIVCGVRDGVVELVPTYPAKLSQDDNFVFSSAAAEAEHQRSHGAIPSSAPVL